MRAAELLAEIGRLAHRQPAYSPASLRSVCVDAEALQLLGDAAGWRGSTRLGALTVYGLPLESTDASGRGYKLMAFDGSVIAEGEITGP